MNAGRTYVKSAEGVPRAGGDEWLARIRTALSDPSSRILKDYAPTSATVTYRVELPGIGISWLKEYRMTPGRKFLSPFRQSRARRVWQVSERLLRAGACIPKLYLVVEESRWGFLRESYVVTEWLEGRIPLNDWYRERKKSGEEKGEAVKSAIMRAVECAARFHEVGAIHGDLKWSNFLLPVGGEGPIVLVDFDACRFDAKPNRRGKDLARFAISALEQGFPAEVKDAVFETYAEALSPPSPGRIRMEYEKYIDRKIPHLLV